MDSYGCNTLAQAKRTWKMALFQPKSAVRAVGSSACSRAGDRRGIIRYSHIGEGAYDKTEAMIRQLLAGPS